METDPPLFFDDMSLADERREAMLYLEEAFAEAIMSGIDGDCIAQAAIFSALTEFVATYGEEAVAKFAERLPERIRQGEFTLSIKH
jgi:hypothetical protein